VLVTVMDLIMSQTNFLQSRLLKLMEQVLHLTIPSIETDLFETGALDSLVFIDLLMLLERDFGLSIDMAAIELEDFKSVDSITTFVNQQQLRKKMQA